MAPPDSGAYDAGFDLLGYEANIELLKQAMKQWGPSKEQIPLLVRNAWEAVRAQQSDNAGSSGLLRWPAVQDVWQAARNSKTCPCTCWVQHEGVLICCRYLDILPDQIGIMEHDGAIYRNLVADSAFSRAAEALELIQNASEITTIVVSKLISADDYWRNRIQQSDIGLIMRLDSKSTGLMPSIVSAAEGSGKRVKEYWIRRICEGPVTTHDLCWRIFGLVVSRSLG